MRVFGMLLAASPLLLLGSEAVKCGDKYEHALEAVTAEDQHVVEAKAKAAEAQREMKLWQKAVKKGFVRWDDGSKEMCSDVGPQGKCSGWVAKVADTEAEIQELKDIIKDNKHIYMKACKSRETNEEKNLCDEYNKHVDKYLPDTLDHLEFLQKKLDKCLGKA